MCRAFSTEPIKFVTFGLGSLEMATRHHVLEGHIRARSFDPPVAEDKAMQPQAFYRAFSQAIETQLILVDCREFGNPGVSSELCRHVCFHPAILARLVKHSRFVPLLQKMRDAASALKDSRELNQQRKVRQLQSELR